MALPAGSEWFVLGGLAFLAVAVIAYKIGKRVGRSEAQAKELADLKARQRTSAA